MNRVLFTAIALFAAVLITGNTFSAVDGTMGTPLGGIGSGSIRFCAHQGTFYTCETTPLAMMNFSQLPSACFQLYTNRGGTVQTSQLLKAVQTNGRADDDAIYPIHTANLGVTNNVSVSLTAFSPVCLDSVNLMCYPYAFFEIKLTNTAATAVDAAIALQISTSANPAWVAGKGIKSTGGLERALYASSGTTGAGVSAGSDNGFFTAGQCNNTISTAINKVAVKVTLAAQATGTIRFVFAWYNGTSTTKDGNTIAPDRLYYTNAFNNAGSVADVGLAQFDRLRNNAVQIVTRMRASNFPDWIKDQTLNSLCNLTTNSIYTKDGRHCYTEGEWNTNGTSDQMWHARQITTMTVPDLAWQELEYWARTQKTSPLGQIHHDMGAPASKLWGFDDQQHQEYSYQPDCNPWVDLNCGFIISIYEAYIATGNKTRLDYFWPYAKNSGQRILDQVTQYGNTQYPYTFNTSLNTYDQPSNNLNPFNGGLSTVAYKVMIQLAQIYNDNTLKTKYQNAFDTAKISFEKRYLTNNWPTETRFVESILAGQWISFYLKFGQLYSQAGLDYGLTRQDANYNAAANGMGTPAGGYNEWAEYLVSHYGGLCLQTGRLNLWRSMQFDYYERNYLNRNSVFNQPLDIPAKVTTPTYLATNTDVTRQYISLPVLWRNYYSLLGYGRNKPTGELWLEPVIPAEMNHKMTNGFYFSPEGSGTISDTESGTTFQNQLIVYKPDKPIAVTSLYLRDKSTDSVAVLINNIRKTVTRTGAGYSKELKVDYSGTMDSSGTTIRVLYGKDITGIQGSIDKGLIFNTSESRIFKIVGGTINFTRGLPGIQTLSVFDLSGSLVRRAIVKNQSIDLRKDLHVSQGAYIVRVKAEAVKVVLP
jgi:hypothetical protein